MRMRMSRAYALNTGIYRERESVEDSREGKG